jgi:uncharacterized protein
MTYDITTQVVAFVGEKLLASGNLSEVAGKAKLAFDGDTSISPLVFDATTSARIDLDLGGTPTDVLARLPLATALPVRGPGRPKLGVTAREVTLLPRHWEWLASQPGGASVALRKLVEQARKSGVATDERRQAQTAIYKFMTALAGDFIGYEDATRALFADDYAKFIALTLNWPSDISAHLKRLAFAAFSLENDNA